jgi:hypothetical protein
MSCSNPLCCRNVALNAAGATIAIEGKRFVASAGVTVQLADGKRVADKEGAPSGNA